jgi:hypothetical protein
MRRVAILIIILHGNWLYAQNYVDVAKIYFNTSSLNGFKNSLQQTRVTEYGLDVTYPIVLKGKNTLLTGLSYESTQVKFFEHLNYETVSSIAFRIGVNRKHSDRLSGSYIFIPKAASDFKRSSAHNFQFGMLALLRINRSERMNYKVGLYYNTELFGTFFTPILGLYYLSENKRWETNLNLPTMADINFKPNQVITVGLNFTGQIKSYRIANVLSTGLSGYLVKSSNEICGYLKINFTKGVSLQGRIGYSIARNYRVFKEDDKIDLGISLIKIGDDRDQLNTKFSNGMVYQAILLYRFVQK